MNVLVCEGCGRVAGEREVYCGACGRVLPGRSTEENDAAPPGWLVSPTARDQEGPWFEPLPAVAVPVPERSRPAPAYRVAEQRSTPAPPPPTLPLSQGPERAPAGGAAALTTPAPALRALLVPLLVCALGSSAGAVILLVVHLLRDR